MKYLSFFLFFFIPFTIFSNVTNSDILDLSDKSSSSTILIDVRSGDLFIQKKEATIQGIEPIDLSYYYHKDDRRRNLGILQFFPHLILTMPSFGDFFSVDTDGFTIKYKKSNGEKDIITFTPDTEYVIFDNFASVKKNIFNNKIILDNKNNSAHVKLSDGTERFYKEYSDLNQLFRTFYLIREKKPNGNQILYKYDKYNKLEEISTTDKNNQIIYASIQIKYSSNNEKTLQNGNLFDFEILANTNQHFEYKFLSSDRKYSRTSYILEKIISDEVNEKLQYHKNFVSRNPLLAEITISKGKTLHFEYYDDKNEPSFSKLKSVKLSTNGKYENNVYSFEYFLNKTKVTDKNGNYSYYCYNNNSHVHEIDHYTDNELYKREKFFFNNDKIFCHCYLSSDNLCQIAYKYHYDKDGSIIKKTVLGNLSGDNENKVILDNNLDFKDLDQYSTQYTYSYDSGINLIKKEEDNGLVTEYNYLSNTSLVSSKFIKDKNKILLRSFYEYDHNNQLIKEINDDGSSYEKNNLENVINRNIKIFYRSDKEPYLGHPEYIEEKYLDISNNTEKLLKKIKLYYDSKHNIIREDIFDSNNEFLYSTHSTYNTKNLLSANINPLNQKSSYKYDKNKNLISIESARLKSFMQYDIYNRLIKKSEFIPSFNPVITKYNYDTFGNILEKTNFQGHITKYKYNSLNLCIETTCPIMEHVDDTKFYPIISYKYDIFGNIVEEVIDQNFKKGFTYNAYNKKVKTIINDNVETENIYNLDGTLYKTINKDRSYTITQYDVLKRPILKKTYSSYNKLTMEEQFSYHGNLCVMYSNSKGLNIEYIYDNAGRIIEEKHNNKTKTKYEYDPQSRINKSYTFFSDNLFFTTEYKKDILDNLKETIKQDNNEEIISIRKFEYDDNNNITKIENISENNTLIEEINEYDDKNRIVKHISEDCEYTCEYNDSYTFYDTQCVTQKITRYKNKTVTETFDPYNRLISYEEKFKDKDTVNVKYYYDFNNNLLKKIEQEFFIKKPIKTYIYYYKNNKISEISTFNNKTLFNYDDSNRLASIQKPDNKQIKIDYNSDSVEITSSDNSIHYICKYDYSQNNKITVYDPINEFSFERYYDNCNVIKETFPYGSISYSYDLQNRLTNIDLFDNSSIFYEQDAKLLKYIHRIKNNEKIYSYNCLNNSLEDAFGKNLIDNLKTTTKEDNYISYNQKSPFYNHEDVICKESKNLIRSASSLFGNTEYIYDEPGKINKEHGLFVNFYVFDYDNTLINKNNIENTFTNNGLIEKSKNEKYHYDENLNCISIENKNDSFLFSYDILNRLISAESKKEKIVYSYDIFNRRTKRITYEKKKNKYIPKDTTFYLNIKNEEIGTINDNKITCFKLDQHPFNNKIASIEINDSTYLPIQNSKDCIIALLETTNLDIKESYYYDILKNQIIFDNTSVITNLSNINNPWRHEGLFYEESINKYFINKRFYHPTSGMFLNNNILSIDIEKMH